MSNVDLIQRSDKRKKYWIPGRKPPLGMSNVKVLPAAAKQRRASPALRKIPETVEK
jgi:hypothetical protein